MLYVPASHLKKPLHLPTKAKEVFGVSGAGDTVIATLGAALGAGFDIAYAMLIANTAAGIVVSKLGTATTTIDEIALLLSGSSTSACDRKIILITIFY
jgi:D-beta-D-heptose 7-phosphate kinase/D-beta-D-heptose 1-phosphate adenosyltransferase